MAVAWCALRVFVTLQADKNEFAEPDVAMPASASAPV